jgi:hypothetical protein
MNDTWDANLLQYIGREELTIYLTDPLYVNFQPTHFIQSPMGGFLLLGTQNIGTISSEIQILKLNGQFAVEHSRSFGTGSELDRAVKINVLPDGSVVFLATVNYTYQQNHSKIVLYKLTQDLELNY